MWCHFFMQQNKGKTMSHMKKRYHIHVIYMYSALFSPIMIIFVRENQLVK